MKCRNCFKTLIPREGEIHLNPKRIFCDNTCCTRYCALKRHHLVLKKFPELTEKRNEKNRMWYKKNKEKHKENVLKDYYKNRHKWVERSYVNRNKIMIWNILGKVCKVCGKEAQEVNHLKYDFPRRDCTLRGERHIKYIKWYCQYLEPLCMPCHRKKKPKYNNKRTKKIIESLIR
jgi:hypothetical protein